MKKDALDNLIIGTGDSVVQATVSFQPKVIYSCLKNEQHNGFESLWQPNRQEEGDNVIDPSWELQSSRSSDTSPSS